MSSITKWWSIHPSASAFLPLKDNSCLISIFDAYRRSNCYRQDSSFIDAIAAGAIGHASISAVSQINSLMGSFKLIDPNYLEYQEWFAIAAPKIERIIIDPIKDVSRLAASLYARAGVSIRTSVISQADDMICLVL